MPQWNGRNWQSAWDATEPRQRAAWVTGLIATAAFATFAAFIWMPLALLVIGAGLAWLTHSLRIRRREEVTEEAEVPAQGDLGRDRARLERAVTVVLQDMTDVEIGNRLTEALREHQFSRVTGELTGSSRGTEMRYMLKLYGQTPPWPPPGESGGPPPTAAGDATPTDRTLPPP
jgi:hypothetical protein